MVVQLCEYTESHWLVHFKKIWLLFLFVLSYLYLTFVSQNSMTIFTEILAVFKLSVSKLYRILAWLKALV